MASEDTLRKLAEHPTWIRPRSDSRVFLGEPGAPEATKTTVEPGNAFSPGMGSFGVTWWLRRPAEDAFFAPEHAPLASLRWSLEDGCLPLLRCATSVGGLSVVHSLFQDGRAGEWSEAVCGRLRLANGPQPARVQVFVVLRSLGPAGGPIPSLRLGAGGRLLETGDGAPLLAVDRVPDAAGCGPGDPSDLARMGQVPGDAEARDPDGWTYGLLRWDLALAPGEEWAVRLDCPHQTRGALRARLAAAAAPRPDAFERRALTHLEVWRGRLGPTSLEVPDRRFRDAFYAGLGHMLTASVGDQARIAPLSYPLPWLRDAVFIIRSLDLAGLHERARAMTDHVARNDFFGGFGAEGDAPGQGIWAIVQHYRLTRDRAWLARVYPDVRRKADWLRRMRRATGPIRVTTDAPVLAFTHADRAAGVVCLAARAGVIAGVMDHGVDHAVGWVNQWAIAGLREAAYAARELGLPDADADRAEADELVAALRGFAASSPSYWEHERTICSLVWPTRAWDGASSSLRARFDAWWTEHRGHGAAYTPEPYWLYFEFAQAHNALLLGRREWAWQTVDHRLDRQDVPGLYGYREGGEGRGVENVTAGGGLVGQVRGCHRLLDVTPHGWSQAELWLLQRAMLVDEVGDGLVLFAGVPAAWLVPAGRVAYRDLPTWHGPVSAAVDVASDGGSAAVTVAGVRAGTPVKVLLPGGVAETVAGPGPTRLRIEITPNRK